MCQYHVLNFQSRQHAHYPRVSHELVKPIHHRTTCCRLRCFLLYRSRDLWREKYWCLHKKLRTMQRYVRHVFQSPEMRRLLCEI